MKRATVFFMPQTETDLVITKPCWAADNGYETAVFPTQAEAIEFCWKRWRVPAEQVRVEGETNKLNAASSGTENPE